MFLWPQEAANLTHAHAQVVFENLLVETIWPWHRNFNYCLFAAQVPKVFLRFRAIPGDEAPGEAGIGTSKPCFLAAYVMVLFLQLKGWWIFMQQILYGLKLVSW